MRSSFGRFAQEMRAKRGITQSAFANAIGESLSRVSQLEHQRTNINDCVVGKYIKALDLNGEEICELRRHAEFSNSRLSARNKSLPHDSLHALLAQFGEKISEKTVRRIRQLIIEEVGQEVATLEYASNRSRSKENARKKTRQQERPNLSVKRFVELCLLAEQHRLSFMDSKSRYMDVEALLAHAAKQDPRFDVDVLECLPSYAEGAFACIVGHSDGNTILLEEEGYRMAVRGSAFRRHVICHEYAHHVLHPDLLTTDAESYLPVQEWAKAPSDTDDMSSDTIYQIVDSAIEVDAECFATMLLVPWTEFVKGTEAKYLSKDFGEHIEEVKRYFHFFKNPSVLNEFKRVLWEQGHRDHMIFK